MVNTLTPSNEDYLEAVHNLAADDESPVRMTDVAISMGVSKASVSKALSVLKEMGYIVQQPYGTLLLTEAGITRAHEVVARHRSIKRFLTEKLGVSDDTAERDACLMEHGISDETIEKLIAFME